ncbi:hypothetical protein AXY19_RS18925, partial [Acinetobacter baumannii]|nr:hypothetical protein [Acinetobacter baumannii]
MTTLFQSDKFFEFSRQVAQKFIQSVVAVDDEMEFSARPKTFFEEEELIEPENSLLGFNYEIQSSNLEKSNFDNSNKLYYQDLSFEFAEK